MNAKITTRLLDSIEARSKPYEVRDKDLKGFILRVQPSGVISFNCDYRLPNGVRNRIVLGRVGVLSPARARDQAIQILADLSKGMDPKKEQAVIRVPTFKQFLNEEYAPWAEANQKAGTLNIKALRSPIFQIFFEKRLIEINPWLVEQWRAARKKESIKPVTINRDLARLRSFLQKAVDLDFIFAHPFGRKIKAWKVGSSIRPRFLSESEEYRLRKALDSRETEKRLARKTANEWRKDRNYEVLPVLEEGFADYLKPIILLSINTGLRRGEVFSLRWVDVDFSNEDLMVRAAASKSGKSRHIPLNEEALRILQKWQGQTKGQDDQLVFAGRDGKSLRRDSKKSYKRLLELAEIVGFRWHDMRHHFASRLVMVGVDLNVVRELLGHADLKMTLRYAHLSPQAKAEAVKRLDVTRKESNNDESSNKADTRKFGS